MPVLMTLERQFPKGEFCLFAKLSSLAYVLSGIDMVKVLIGQSVITLSMLGVGFSGRAQL